MQGKNLIILLMLTGIGCTDNLELPPEIERSPHLILRGEAEVCAGTFDELEARVLAVQSLFGAPAATVEYNWMPYSFDEAECQMDASACTRGHSIFARDLGVEHELIHAGRAHRLPRPLEEGLSTYLGGNRMGQSSREELRLAIETDAPFSYQRASELVQFLIEVGGYERLRMLADKTGIEPSFSEWRPVFEDVYGQSWDTLWSTYLASPECNPKTMHDDVYLCHTNTPAVDMTPLWRGKREYLHDMRCEDARVVGPVDGDQLRHEVLVEFDESSIKTLFFVLEGDIVAGSRATLTPCGTCAGEVGAVLTDSDWFAVMQVEAGKYVLEIRQPADAPGTLGVSVSY